ncbi:MAG: elongation factor P [Brevefilum sp.]|nr:elongation factor P [Brevefilum sp.]MDT8380888.1 elongation factor P [Brevefilum sp.]MDW7755520.1 elongation factor P [Brevefilum sp.]
MIDVNELRKGVTFEQDGSLYKVLDYAHNKPGRGQATIRIKARDLRKGTTLDMTFNSGNRVQDVRLDYHNAQFLYADDRFYYFMDNQTYEQYPVNKEIVGDQAEFLKPNMDVKLMFYTTEALDVELPTSVDLLITRAEPSVRGDTATGVTKKVITETGLEVQVPSFVGQGDTIRVDTRNGEYITRV